MTKVTFLVKEQNVSGIYTDVVGDIMVCWLIYRLAG